MKNYNLDFKLHVVIRTQDEEWIDSPASGVKRIPLEREAVESGRASSVVQYAAGSSFHEHIHPLGEEIFVLEGTFSDENGDYRAGTYLRNPPGSSHRSFSKEGCTIFVKLNAMKAEDQNRIVIDTTKANWYPGHGNLQVMPLYNFTSENVALVKWPKGEKFLPHTHFGGEEIFVLSGEFIDEHDFYPKGSWLRSPHLSSHFPYVNEETVILVKTGHL